MVLGVEQGQQDRDVRRGDTRLLGAQRQRMLHGGHAAGNGVPHPNQLGVHRVAGHRGVAVLIADPCPEPPCRIGVNPMPKANRDKSSGIILKLPCARAEVAAVHLRLGCDYRRGPCGWSAAGSRDVSTFLTAAQRWLGAPRIGIVEAGPAGDPADRVAECAREWLAAGADGADATAVVGERAIGVRRDQGRGRLRPRGAGRPATGAPPASGHAERTDPAVAALAGYLLEVAEPALDDTESAARRHPRRGRRGGTDGSCLRRRRRPAGGRERGLRSRRGRRGAPGGRRPDRRMGRPGCRGRPAERHPLRRDARRSAPTSTRPSMPRTNSASGSPLRSRCPVCRSAAR